MSEVITSVGIDAHKRKLHVAMLVGSAAMPVTWAVENAPKAIARLHRKLEREAPGPVRVCYEAGPCGYARQRRLTAGAVTCVVIAPALMPRKPGDRVKTDKRDARKLAELFRAGLLTEVRPPTPAEEAVRDLSRARDDARDDVQRARHRLGQCERLGPARRQWADAAITARGVRAIRLIQGVLGLTVARAAAHVDVSPFDHLKDALLAWPRSTPAPPPAHARG